MSPRFTVLPNVKVSVWWNKKIALVISGALLICTGFYLDGYSIREIASGLTTIIGLIMVIFAMGKIATEIEGNR